MEMEMQLYPGSTFHPPRSLFCRGVSVAETYVNPRVTIDEKPDEYHGAPDSKRREVEATDA